MKVTKKRAKKEDKAKKKDTKDKQSIYTCPHCHKRFTDSSSWYCHIHLHSTEEPYKCEICDYKCKIKKYLSRHIKKVHTKPTGHQCKLCGKCFHFECNLLDHMRVHTGEKPFKCNVCGKAFSSSYSLSGHKLIHTGDKPFQCLYCEYACRDNSTIRRHMERHRGISKDYPCSICKKNFKKKETLQIHVDEVHFELDTRKFPCELCDKVFKTKGTLNIHLNTVHNKANRIKCEICGGRVTKNNIQAHMRRHVDLQPYKCSFKPCGRRFKDKGDLTKHSRIHYPERQYPCSVCDRRFPRKSRLNKHTLQHQKHNVQCDHCGYMFSTKMYLSRHIKKAHGPNAKKYICDHCEIIIYNRRSIIMHLKYGHGTENDTECQICIKDYKNYLSLKEHYLKDHNIKYSLLQRKKEDDIVIKEEPYEELVVLGDPPEFMYELEVQKQEIDDMIDIPILDPQTPEHYAIDSDTITYSKKVLSEDISRSLIERDNNMSGDEFDDFFIGHVMRKPEDIIEMPKQIIDEKKKERVEKCLENLLSEVRLRKQWKVLKKLRRKYNRRIKMATSIGNKKEHKSIRYFKKAKINSDITDLHNDKGIEKENDDSDKKKDQDIINEAVDDNNKIGDQKIVDDQVTDPDIGDDDKMDDEKANDDDDANDSDYKDSDFDSNSDKETNTNGKLKFNTHQCYICFKLFKTKTDLKRHCKDHFDICSEKMLKKCPFCGYVTDLHISRHIRLVHKIEIDIQYGRVKERDTQNGSKYVFEIDKNCDLEIIPSISNLNKIASMKIDEKNRASKNIFLGTTKLVKKGKEWIVEKQAVDINNEHLLPEFSDEEYKTLKSVGNNYLEQIKSLSILAKKKGMKILYPCEGCDKICLTLSALKLHNRKHEANPKRFRPKVWKNKILNGKVGKNSKNKNKNRKKYVDKNKNSAVENENGNKSSKMNGKTNKRRGRLEVVVKNGKNTPDKLANRFAAPNPVKNKHKCKKELIEFYKNNIKGGDVEFWQFLKIFNKMSRENVNDFKDLENRHDFGTHNIINTVTENVTESNTELITDNNQKNTKNVGKRKKNAFTRAIMISKKEYLKRIEIKNQMRRNLAESKS